MKGKNVSQWFTSAGWIFETKDERQDMENKREDQDVHCEETEGELENIYFLRPKRTTLDYRLRVTGCGSNRGDSWNGASGGAFLDFLTQCLRIDPRKRIDTKEATAHQFVNASS